MKPGYTTTQFKYGNALNASNSATPRAYTEERKDAGSIQIYMRRKTAPKTKELDI